MKKENKKLTASSSSRTKRGKKRHYVRKSGVLLFKTVLFTIMFVFVLCGVCWIAIVKMFNAQPISEAMTRQLQLVFDRPVVISSLDLKFFNTVELKGFAILDTKVQPGTPVVSAESVLIRYQLLPLLEHKLIIDEVTLNKPRFEVLRSAAGGYNVPPVNMPKSGQQETTYVNEKTGEKIQIHIEDWTIREGVVSYKDLKSGSSHAIYDLNIHFDNLHFYEWSSFKLETVLRNQWSGHISDLEIRGKGEINFANFNWEQFALRNFRTQVAVFRKPVLLSVNLENLRTPSFTATAKAPEFTPEDLSVFEKNLPAFRVPAGTIKVTGKLDDAYNQLHLDNVNFQSPQLTATASGMINFAASPFTVSLQAKTGWTDLTKFSQYYPALARFQLSGQGQVEASVSRQKGKYSLPKLEIGAKEVTGSFWGFLAEKVSGSFIAKQNFADLYAQTTGGTVRVADSTFEQLNMTGSYRQGDVYAYISSALLNTVPLKMRLSINNIKDKARTIDTSIYLKKFDPMAFIDMIGDFVKVISAISKNPAEPHPVQTGELAWMRNFRDRLPEFMPNFSGTLYADTFASTVLSGEGFNAEFAFTGLLPGAAQLNGTLDMKLNKGVIHQMEKLAEEQEALNITFTPFIMLHRMESSGSFKVGEVLKDVAVDEMAASVDFKNGTMIINNAFTQGPVISAAVSGWTDWVRETFELVIWTMITPSSRRGILAENLTDENGNPALAFKVSSSMLKPKLEMLRAKKTNTQIQTARKRGLRTEFIKNRDFMKGEFNAKK